MGSRQYVFSDIVNELPCTIVHPCTCTMAHRLNSAIAHPLVLLFTHLHYRSPTAGISYRLVLSLTHFYYRSPTSTIAHPLLLLLTHFYYCSSTCKIYQSRIERGSIACMRVQITIDISFDHVSAFSKGRDSERIPAHIIMNGALVDVLLYLTCY